MLEGYVEFLLLLFLPGVALFELFKVGEGLSLASKLALALGLGMSADVVLLVVRTSNLEVAGVYLNGLYPNTIYLILGACAAVLVVSVVYHRKTTFYISPTRTDFAVLLLVAVQALLVCIHFSTFPIFPEFQSVDFGQHVQVTVALQSARIYSIPGGILYEGVHLLMASLVVLTNGEPLITTQYAMGILLALSPLLFYSCTQALAQSERTALIATAIYVGGGSIWFESAFNAGLYPNFYGFVSMFLVISWIPLLRKPGIAQWPLFALIVANGYFSHYSFLTLLPALLVIPFAELATVRKVSRGTMGMLAIVYIPAIVALIARPNLVSLLLQFQSAQGGALITGGTALSRVFSFFPFLQYVATEVFNDVGTVLLLLMFAAGVYVAVRRKSALLALPIVWFATLAVVSPVSLGAWRFSFVGLIPLTIVASVGIDSITASRRSTPAVKRTRAHRRSGRGWARPSLLVLLVLAISGSSWSYQIVSTALSYPQTSQAQVMEYQSMLWIKQNTPTDAVIIAVTDQDYSYTLMVTGRLGGVAPLVPPSEIPLYTRNVTNAYIVVTQYATVSGTADQITRLAGLYQTAKGFSLVYQNADVSVYLRL